MYSLRDRALDPGPPRILHFEQLGVLAFAGCLERDKVIPFAHQQRAWLPGRPGTLPATPARDTARRTERDLHTRMPMPIAPFRPPNAQLPLRTAGLLGVPIKHKLRGGEAVSGRGLPTGGVCHRLQQVNAILGAAAEQMIGTLT